MVSILQVKFFVITEENAKSLIIVGIPKLGIICTKLDLGIIIHEAVFTCLTLVNIK
nr:MAG TPA: hypothetical protein [Caudoviricetes sp.]